MLINVIIFVPEILLDQRFEGAVMSILLAIPIGMTLTVLFVNCISNFPQQGLPEILDILKTKWIKKLILFLFSLIWFSAGAITLIASINITQVFMNPEALTFPLYLIFVAAISFAIQLKSDKVLFLLEIILILNLPLLAFVFFKTMGSEYFSWDAMLEVSTYINEAPTWSAVASATYIFSGYLNLVIFNRLFPEKITKKWFVVIFVFSIINLLTTFFIPIAFHGADGVSDYTYPWITTADSLRIDYGPIERVIFLFLMLYLSLSLLSVTIHWHVALYLAKGAFPAKTEKKTKWITWGIIALLVIAGGYLVNILESRLLNTFTRYWMNVRILFEIGVLILLFFLSRWKRK